MMKFKGHVPAQLMCCWIEDDDGKGMPVFMAILRDPRKKDFAHYIPLSQDKSENYDEKEFMNLFQHYLNKKQEKINENQGEDK